MIRLKNNKRSKRYRRKKRAGLGIITIVVIGVCLSLTYNRIQLNTKRALAKAEEASLKEQKKQLENKDEEIEEYKAYIHSKEYIEYLARTKFGLVYPNEIVFEAK